MKTPAWLLPNLRLYGLPLVGLALFALVVWRQWPLDQLVADGGMIAWALVGLACVVGPNEFVSWYTLGGQGYSHMTHNEAQTFEDADAVRLIGFVILLDALLGVGRWLVWTWW
ncbi:hypothetical protein Pla108_10430 [Botrimarina colliarenosi]|uniref:Uncharacterized protein n=1 Tax=Botrimarina colliarenosi TaxID=2528001 RepID=A0A5C6ALG8_9BACT|nr:hypothetical protein [Botrimarina colliarenosi]TWU00099.1 hypothetical protein Pla108_10430 [Botrimarina colliarenosi]